MRWRCLLQGRSSHSTDLYLERKHKDKQCLVDVYLQSGITWESNPVISAENISRLSWGNQWKRRGWYWEPGWGPLYCAVTLLSSDAHPVKIFDSQIVVEDNLTCSPGWRDGSWNHSCSCKQFLLFQWSTEHSPGEEQLHLNTHCHCQRCTADTDLDTPPGWWWCPTLWWRQCFPGSNDLTRISD